MTTAGPEPRPPADAGADSDPAPDNAAERKPGYTGAHDGTGRGPSPDADTAAWTPGSGSQSGDATAELSQIPFHQRDTRVLGPPDDAVDPHAPPVKEVDVTSSVVIGMTPSGRRVSVNLDDATGSRQRAHRPRPPVISPDASETTDAPDIPEEFDSAESPLPGTGPGRPEPPPPAPMGITTTLPMDNDGAPPDVDAVLPDGDDAAPGLPPRMPGMGPVTGGRPTRQTARTRAVASSLIAHLKATRALRNDAPGVTLRRSSPDEPDTRPPTRRLDNPLPPLDRPVSPADLPAGTAIGAGRYVIRGVVARGGMGTVLRVFDEDLRRHVAMKVLNPNMPPARGGLERFIMESQIASQLQHPNILPVYDLGMAEGGYIYYTMKLVGGRTFQEVLDRPRTNEGGAQRLREAMEITRKVVDAMAYSHAKGVVHRDLKPANVIVGRYGEVLVMDWGLARVLGPDALPPAPDDKRGRAPSDRINVMRSPGTVPRAGAVVGTPAYMPPEQALGEPGGADTRTDVWALGAVMYRLLAGHPPHLWGDASGRPDELLRRARQDGVRPLPKSTPWGRRIPPLLTGITHKALTYDPDHRYADAGEMLTALDEYEAERDKATTFTRRITRAFRVLVDGRGDG